jgi:hypothetical protein
MTSPDLSRSHVIVLLGLCALAFWWMGLEYLQGGAPYGDDNSSHFAVILAVARLLKAGQTDFFFAQNNLGVALFLSYQPLPAFLMALFVLLTSSWLEPLFVYKASILAIWSMMPIVWYIGGRWMGLSRTAALTLGLLTWGIEDPQFYGFTFTSVAYKGLYTQSFGLLFFPLGLGSWWRWLRGRGGSKTAVVGWMVLTFLSHIFFGLYLGIASLLMVLGAGWRERGVKALQVYAVSIAVMAFWMLPLLLNVSLVGGLPWKSITHNGWPLAVTLKRAMGGVLLDQHRLPWLTLLLFVAMVALWKRRKRSIHGWLWGLWAATFVLFLGRTNLGALYQWIPLHRELNVMRYLSGLHICALLTIAFAVDIWRQRAVEEGFWLRWVGREFWWLAAALLLVTGYSGQRLWQHRQRLHTFAHNKPSFRALRKHLSRDREHRFLVDGSLKTGSHFHRDLLPALVRRPQVQSYGMTFHAHLSLYYSEYFDWSAAAYRLFNITSVVARTDKPKIPIKPLREVFRAKPYVVFSPRKKDFGLFETIRVPFAIRGSYKQMRPFIKQHLLTWYRRGFLPLTTRHASGMAWEVRVENRKLSYWYKGRPSTHTRFSAYLRSLPDFRSTRRLREFRSGLDYSADLHIQQENAWLLFKVNYFPFWKAYTRNKEWKVRQVGPGFMAVKLPKGVYHVRFRYQNPLWQKLLFLLTMAGLMGLGCRRLVAFFLRFSTSTSHSTYPK